MKSIKICCLFTLILGLTSNFSYSQLNVTTGSTALQYAQEIVGTGVTVSNVTLTTNNSHQIGKFTNGSSTNIGLNEGVILSTGNVADASGSAVNEADGEYTSMGCGFLGMEICTSNAPDLSDIINDDVFDAAILEFDFIPSGPTISFQFVFGSEEYPMYVGSINDAFGIFLSGSGISGPFSNNGVNLATIPNTTTPISINNVNDGNSYNCVNPGPSCTNCAYYVNNCLGTTITYNGFTTVISSTYAVQCGQTYHIKFGIGDANDGILDSGVFIKGQSLESGIEITPNPVTICQGDNVLLTATVVGATGGSYSWEPNGQTTTSITASPSTTTDYIAHYTNNGCEITDTVTVTVDNCGCTSPDLIINDIDICSGDVADLNNAINPSSDAATSTFYSSQNDASNANNPIGNTVTTSGSYWVRGENPSDPTCFNVYEIIVNVTTVSYTLDSFTNPTCGNNDGELNLSASGGQSPYNFSIDNGTTTQSGGTFSNLGAGTFTILITDANGCKVSGTESLSNAGGQTIDNMNATDPSCSNNDGVLQVDVSGGTTPYTYQWFDVNNNPIGSGDSINGLSAGDYSVEVTDDNGCTVTDNATLIAPLSAANPSFGFNQFCEGATNGPINIVTSGGTFSFSPATTDGATIDSATGEISNGVGGTTYTVKYELSGVCPSSSTVNVTVWANPTFTFSTTNPTCGNSDGTITISGLNASSNYNLIYVANGTPVGPQNKTTNGTGEIVINNLPFGNYTNFEISNSNGCSTVDALGVTLDEIGSPTVSAPNDIDICLGESVTLTAGNPGGATISWSIGANDGVAFTPTSSGSTTYTVTALNSIGCSATDQVIVNVHDAPIINAGVDQIICLGEPETLTATGATTYNWTNIGAGATQTVTPIVTTTYEVTGTDNYGCINTDQVKVTVNPVPVPQFEGDKLEGCEPLTVKFTNLTNPSGGTCKWNFGDGNTSTLCDNIIHTYQSGGSYNVSLTITDAIGCSGTHIEADYIKVMSKPEAMFTADPMVTGTSSPTITFTNGTHNGTDFTWIFGDGSAEEHDLNATHYYPDDKNDNYIVTLIASNGPNCDDTVRAVIKIEDELIFYVPNTFTPDADKFNETFKPIFSSGFDPQTYTLSIYDRWGEVIFESHNTEIGWDGTYGTKSSKVVKQGTYIWKIDIKETGKDKHNTYTGHITLLK